MTVSTSRKGRHGRAIEAAIRHGSVALTDGHQPLLELCRDLAEQMDAAGADGPSARLSASYLSALKDLSRATSNAGPKVRTSSLSRLASVPRPATREGS